MTRNISPAMRDYLAAALAITESRRADDEAPVIVPLPDGRTLRLRNDVPKTRGDCPVEKPCGHVRCSNHLWITIGSDRAGRRVAGKPPATDLNGSRYRKWAPSCALDVADVVAISGEPLAIVDAAAALQIRPSQYHALLATALRKLRAHPEVLEALVAGER